jgi:GDPmannose 4,6-dehydratase
MPKRALVIGISGQDGAYLAEHLLGLDYEVYGGSRRTSSGGPWRLEKLDIREKIIPICMDVLDEGSVIRAIEQSKPDEIYNLAAQGHVGDSWAVPSYTLSTNAIGALNVFLHMGKAKVFQASTLAIFGNQVCPPSGFDELTPIQPVDPYGASKANAHALAHAYRGKGRFIASGIMGNHESPLRQDSFVTQKIARAIKKWRETKELFTLHNVTGIRDWGAASEYVVAMHLMLQQSDPDDYVIATGCRASVGQFLEAAIGEDIYVKGNIVFAGERPVCRLQSMDAEKAPVVIGNPAKANSRLKWAAMKRYGDIAREMVAAA